MTHNIEAKIKGAPFLYKGVYWADDPTRILSFDDYAEGSVNLPFVFPNGVVVYEPTQLVKKVFWEQTGFSDFEEVLDHLSAPHVNGISFVTALFNLKVNEENLFRSDGRINSDAFQYPTRFNKSELITRLRGSTIKQLYEEEGLVTHSAPLGIQRSQAPNFILCDIAQQGTQPEAIYFVQPFEGRLYHRYTNNSELPTVEEGSLRNYSYKVEHSLVGFRSLPSELSTDENPQKAFFGMELEVDTDLSIHELQYIVQHVEPKQETFFICKSDGSISHTKTYQYEIVTCPMTPALLRREWKTLFGKIQKLCQTKGKTISQIFARTPNNGLHIHISKKAFEEDYPFSKRGANSWGSRFLSMFSSDFIDEKKFLTEISGRADLITNSYCGIDRASVRYRRISARVGAKHLQEYNRERHTPAHGRNAHTYEVRIFAGAVELEHILCSIDFVEAAWVFSGCHGGISCVKFTRPFKAWLATKQGFAALKKQILKK